MSGETEQGAILVWGAGLVGSYLGAAAQAAWACRRRPGVIDERVLLPDGHRDWRPQSPPPSAYQGPCLLATRCHQADWQQVHRLCLAAQNGIGQACPVAVCFCALDRDAQGTIFSPASLPPRLVVARLHPVWKPILTAWRQCGIIVDEVDDIRPWQWEKAILNATLGPLCLVTGRSLGQLWADPQWRRLCLDATQEGALIAHAQGIQLEPGMLQRSEAFFSQIGDHQPSVLRSPQELSWIFGPLLAAAQKQQIATPALQQIADWVSDLLGPSYKDSLCASRSD